MYKYGSHHIEKLWIESQWLSLLKLIMVATMLGKSGKIKKPKKYDKSPEKSGEKEGFWKKVMKSQEIWYKNAVNKKVYHH